MNLFLILFAVFWCGMLALMDAIMLPSAWGQIRALFYPSTTGVIDRSELKSSHGSKGMVYAPDVTYHYFVEGKRWESNRLYYGMASSSSQGGERRLLEEFPAGAEVRVYFNPSSPGDALLRPGLQPEHLFIALFGTPFHLVGAVLVAGVWRKRKTAIKHTLDGLRLSVQMPWFSPLAAGLGALGLGAFLGIFVAAFGFGTPPPMPAITGIWAIILGLAICFAVRQSRRLRAGLADLTVDATARTVTLPLHEKRKERVTLPFEEVHETILHRRVTRTSKGGTREEFELSLGIGNGPPIPLHKDYTADKLRAIAQLLSDTFGWKPRDPVALRVDTPRTGANHSST